MSKRKTITAEESPRDAHGLTAANNGDPDGVWKFLNWCARETDTIAYFGRQPALIASRMKGLANDMMKLAEFAHGFSEAKRPRRNRRA